MKIITRLDDYDLHPHLRARMLQRGVTLLTVKARHGKDISQKGQNKTRIECYNCSE